MWRQAARVGWRGARYVAPRATSRLSGYVGSSRLLGPVSRGLGSIGRFNANPARATLGWRAGAYEMQPLGSALQRRGMQTAAAAGARVGPSAGTRAFSKKMLAGAAAGALGTGGAVYQASKPSKNTTKGAKKNNSSNKELHAVGDTGDSVATKDTFTSTTGSPIWKELTLLSTQNQVKNGTSGGIKSVVLGRAQWQYLNEFKNNSTIEQLFKDTTMQYRNDNAGDLSAPTWHRQDDLLNTNGYYNQQFVYDGLKYKIHFKNQSSMSVHLEYYIICPKNTVETARDWWADFQDGCDSKLADQSTVFTVGQFYLPDHIHFSNSPTFMKFWNIKYKKKVLMCEGGTHDFTYTDNTNKKFNLQTLKKCGHLKYTTDLIIARVYGTYGDTNINIGTIGDVTTGLAKVIFRTDWTETVRHGFASPNIMVDKRPLPVTTADAVYTKDPNTGDVDDDKKEDQ